MKYALMMSLLCAPLLYSGAGGFTQGKIAAGSAAVTASLQQENVSVTTNEGRAMKSLRAILDAETKFQAAAGKGEYGDLKELRDATLIDDDLASGIKDGYRFTIIIKKSTLSTPPSIDLVARPGEYGKNGRRSFYLTEAGVLLTSEKQDAPLSEMRPFASGGAVTATTQVKTAAPDDDSTAGTSDEESLDGDVTANEATVLTTLRAIHSAEATFKTKAGAGEYGTLEQLLKQKLIEGARISPERTGYVFEIKILAGKPDSAFTVSATPQSYGRGGRRSFIIDHTGTLRGSDKEGGPADMSDPKIEK